MIKVVHYIVVISENADVLYLTPGELGLPEEIEDLPKWVHADTYDWPIIGITTNSVLDVLHTTKPMTLLRKQFPSSKDIGRRIDVDAAAKSMGKMIKQSEFVPLCGVFQKQIKMYDGKLGSKQNISEREAKCYMNEAVRRELKLGRVDGDKVETKYSVYTWKADK